LTCERKGCKVLYMAQPTTSKFSPDSVYATHPPEWVEAADRMEADYNARRSAILSTADLMRRSDPVKQPKNTGPLWIAGPTVRTYTDEMLSRARKRYRRELEDIAEGDHNLPATGRSGVKARVRFLGVVLLDVEREQEFRAALAESWLAAEGGTHCYTSFQGRGGLAAVADHGATPPSYDLAVLLDRENFRRGLPHALDWESESQELANAA
jgi:hypothetical protein